MLAVFTAGTSGRWHHVCVCGVCVWYVCVVCVCVCGCVWVCVGVCVCGWVGVEFDSYVDSSSYDYVGACSVL